MMRVWCWTFWPETLGLRVWFKFCLPVNMRRFSWVFILRAAIPKMKATLQECLSESTREVGNQKEQLVLVENIVS